MFVTTRKKAIDPSEEEHDKVERIAMDAAVRALRGLEANVDAKCTAVMRKVFSAFSAIANIVRRADEQFAAAHVGQDTYGFQLRDDLIVASAFIAVTLDVPNATPMSRPGEKLLGLIRACIVLEEIGQLHDAMESDGSYCCSHWAEELVQERKLVFSRKRTE